MTELGPIYKFQAVTVTRTHDRKAWEITTDSTTKQGRRIKSQNIVMDDTAWVKLREIMDSINPTDDCYRMEWIDE